MSTTYRVKFVVDEDARFEECNGESRPLTKAEYAKNQYMGCPTHPRGFNGTKEHDTTSPPKSGRGVCACGKRYQPIPYAEYLAYYGNPDRHVYLGCIVERECPCCYTFKPAGSLWHIDCMDDDKAFTSITLGRYYSDADARALPDYLGQVAGEVLDDAIDNEERKTL